jgi:hypothetical protein
LLMIHQSKRDILSELLLRFQLYAPEKFLLCT